ncbi:hypothetical protein EDB80DRAFT_865553 [Ilyonectria destructans]|nr:hypothetical protein EDB80DRAFT_865553 [Ilyonectria destructans]
MAPMNMFRAFSSSLIALSAASSAVAQFYNESIVGCSTVGCPTVEGGTTNDCRVVDNNFTVIGVARIPVNTSSPLSGVSWVQGVSVVNMTDSQYSYEKTFYLGTPAEMDISNVGACALFFHNTTSMVKFDGDDDEESQGTCQEAMSESCVAAMNDRAKVFNYDGLTLDEACAKLQEEFDDNLDSECKSFTGSDNWTNIKVKALSGLSEITTKTNGSSNCWPILPKSDNLNVVESYEYIGNNSAATIAKNLYGITPILIVFFPGNGTLITNASSQMTCMKSLGDSVLSESTKSKGDDDEDDDNGAMTLGASVGVNMLGAGLLSLLYLI